MKQKLTFIQKLKKTVKWIVVAFFASTILSVVVLRWVPVYFTPLMLIRLAQQKANHQELTLHHHWVPIEEMNPAMATAVMASEDARFLEHHGFDFKAIEHAARRNMEHPEKRRLGASTISQQTAKNVFLWPGRSWVRKGFEAYFTVLIELFWSKQRIMEVYLNSIEMGDGIYGADAVAEWHFHCQAADLSLWKGGNEFHFMHYLLLPFLHVSAGIGRTELAGVGQRGGNKGTLAAGEVFGILVEVLLGYGLGPIDAVAHLDGVEIDLHDALLGPEEFDECGEIDLKALAHPAATWPQEDILGRLLRDGGGTQLTLLWMLTVALGCMFNGLVVEAVMIIELAILAGYDGHRQ